MTLSMILTHLALVVAALVFAILAGVPLGILCYFYPSARRVVLRVVDLIQTTPALALLGIIMVFMGAGKPTVIVGLALYSLLPIVRNTSLGLSQVPAMIRSGVIPPEMALKANCSVEAVRSGVRSATLLDGSVPHAILLELLSDEGIGTMIL